MNELLDTCGCCRADVPEPRVHNRPGLPAIEHRVGIHPEFMLRMLDALPRATRRLTTRDPDDPSLALLDGFATMADVLTFYQQRIANEGFLRTATERRSVLELARAIGYELNPGVAASAYLRFSVDDLPPPPGQARTPGRATVPRGTKVQSMPGQNELPQTFETSREIVGRAEWNELRPRLKRPQPLGLGSRRLYVEGLATGLGVGDRILITAPQTDGTGVDTQVVEIAAIAEEPQLERTRIDLKELGKRAPDVKPPPPFKPKQFPPPTFHLVEQPLTETVLLNDVIKKRWPERRLRAYRRVHRWDRDLFVGAIDHHLRVHHDSRFKPRFHFDFVDFEEIFEPREPDPPLVRSHSPAAGATGMSPRVNVTVRFDEEMDPTSINATTITLRRVSDGSLVPAVVSYSAATRSAVLNPTGSLAIPTVQYAARVAGGANGVRSAEQVPLKADYTSTFTTANVDPAPFITGSTPPQDAKDVPPDTAITVTFSEPLKPSTVTASSLKLKRLVGESFADVAAIVSYDEKTRTASVKPKAPLAHSTHYQAEATTAITDLTNRPLSGDRQIDWDTAVRPPVQVPTPAAPIAYAFRDRAGFFGSAAPRWGSLAKDTFQKGDPWKKGWDDDPVSADNHPRTIWTDSQKNDLGDRVYLERAIGELRPSSWAVVEDADEVTPYWITDVDEGARADYALSGPSSSFVVSNTDGSSPHQAGLPDFMVRSTTANVRSEPLRLAMLPIDDRLLTGDRELVLERMVLDLDEGQPLALRGELRDLPGTVGDEIVVLDEIFHEDGFTTLRFRTGLERSYVRRTVTLSANVVVATHGETVPAEVLGGGDGTIPNQRFPLRKPPLTHVSAPTPSGSESTLELRVDGVLWEQAPALYGLGARDRRYLLRAEHDGATSVIFGDGRRGARPPTGVENIVATYRTGIGSPGMVGAERLTLMQTRPLGVTAVTNPLPAGGAAEPESRDAARQNAPLTLTTLERIVSLRDFEDFARAFAGIGKTQAVALWRGSTRIVHLTVAAERGEAVPATSELMTNLVAAMDRVRDPGVKLVVGSFERRYFEVEAELVVDPAHVASLVVEAAQARLADFFSFERRAFGQAATAAEAISELQAVPGVIAVDLNVLRPVADPGAEPVAPALFARPARVEGQATRAAELLLLSPAITELTHRAP